VPLIVVVLAAAAAAAVVVVVVLGAEIAPTSGFKVAMAPVAMLSLAQSLVGCLLSSVAAAKNFSKSSFAREREREREYLSNNVTVVRRRSRVPISFFKIFYPQMPLDTSANCAFSPAGSFFFLLHFPNTLRCGFLSL
jgi:hypothetical protein